MAVKSGVVKTAWAWGAKVVDQCTHILLLDDNAISEPVVNHWSVYFGNAFVMDDIY